MRRRLLILMSLLVLLMQPAALLHGLSHQRSGAQAAAAAHGDEEAATIELACLECLAFTALGSALLPSASPAAMRAPSAPAPALPVLAHRGGTGAGYHARGPPPFLA
ncbi:hypothetical protein HLB44_20285 [Aquincola sp. S2]|uniref:DUF2946 domain-containing protein n=1 Tax=Pseudaquabacterium terrae TaxID=2732868 RepID=A0ABX2ELA3_9BURK|nr:hypothetical protein [Aquabacterium terrae]NRF69341.1 hypothetical protein [Aquabacterium terrae]